MHYNHPEMFLYRMLVGQCTYKGSEPILIDISGALDQTTHLLILHVFHIMWFISCSDHKNDWTSLCFVTCWCCHHIRAGGKDILDGWKSLGSVSGLCFLTWTAVSVILTHDTLWPFACSLRRLDVELHEHFGRVWSNEHQLLLISP